MICSRAWLTVMYLSRIHSIDHGFREIDALKESKGGDERGGECGRVFWMERGRSHMLPSNIWPSTSPCSRWGPKTYLDILPAYKSRWIPRRLVDLAAARHVLLALLLDLYHHSIDLSVSTVMRVLLGHSLSIYESTDMLQDTPAFVPKCKAKEPVYCARAGAGEQP